MYSNAGISNFPLSPTLHSTDPENRFLKFRYVTDHQTLAGIPTPCTRVASSVHVFHWDKSASPPSQVGICVPPIKDTCFTRVSGVGSFFSGSLVCMFDVGVSFEKKCCFDTQMFTNTFPSVRVWCASRKSPIASECLFESKRCSVTDIDKLN